MLSSRGELGHAVNENPRSWRGVVGDSRSNVNVDVVTLDCQLPGDSLQQQINLWRLGNNVVRKPTRCPGQASSGSLGNAPPVSSCAEGQEQ